MRVFTSFYIAGTSEFRCRYSFVYYVFLSFVSGPLEIVGEMGTEIRQPSDPSLRLLVRSDTYQDCDLWRMKIVHAVLLASSSVPSIS